MRFADPQTGQVAIFGVVQETTDALALRHAPEGGERHHRRSGDHRGAAKDAGIPFVTADIKPLPVWDEILPAAARTPREKMIDAGQWLFRHAAAQRRHAAHASSPPTAIAAKTACSPPTIRRPGLDADLGAGLRRPVPARAVSLRRSAARPPLPRWWTRSAASCWPAGFIDHEGRLGEFKLTDGTKRDVHLPPPAFLRAARGCSRSRAARSSRSRRCSSPCPTTCLRPG